MPQVGNGVAAVKDAVYGAADAAGSVAEQVQGVADAAAAGKGKLGCGICGDNAIGECSPTQDVMSSVYPFDYNSVCYSQLQHFFRPPLLRLSQRLARGPPPEINCRI